MSETADFIIHVLNEMFPDVNCDCGAVCQGVVSDEEARVEWICEKWRTHERCKRMRIELPEDYFRAYCSYEFIGCQLTRNASISEDPGVHEMSPTELIARLDRGEVLEIGYWPPCVICGDTRTHYHAMPLDWSQDAGPQEPICNCGLDGSTDGVRLAVLCAKHDQTRSGQLDK